MKALDPDDDDKTFYANFEKWLQNAPEMIFMRYDYDYSTYLETHEMADLLVDLGVPVNETDLVTLTPDQYGRVSFDTYATWLRNYPSKTRNAREYLKVNNAVHKSYSDELVGPLRVVESRRAKYIGINKLSADAQTVGPLLREIEGDWRSGSGDDLITMLSYQPLFDIMGLSNDSEPLLVPSRISLDNEEMSFTQSYWNGREWEKHQPAVPDFNYGADCLQIHGTTEGCPPALTHSPHVTWAQELYDDLKIVNQRQDWIERGAVDNKMKDEPMEKTEMFDRPKCSTIKYYGAQESENSPICNPAAGFQFDKLRKYNVILQDPQVQHGALWGVTEQKKLEHVYRDRPGADYDYNGVTEKGEDMDADYAQLSFRYHPRRHGDIRGQGEAQFAFDRKPQQNYIYGEWDGKQPAFQPKNSDGSDVVPLQTPVDRDQFKNPDNPADIGMINPNDQPKRPFEPPLVQPYQDNPITAYGEGPLKHPMMGEKPDDDGDVIYQPDPRSVR
jgi:hypothetical protein